jgi:hypothetical protein
MVAIYEVKMNKLLPLLLCLIASTAQAQYSPWLRQSLGGGAVETRTAVRTDSVGLRGDGATAQSLRFWTPNGGNYTEIKSQAQAANISYSWPAAAPTVSGQALVSTDAGVMSWSTVTTSPAGANTQIQFNNGGAFGASSNLTFGTTNTGLSITAASATTVPSRITLAAAHTANAIEINSIGGSGGDLAKVSASGSITSAGQFLASSNAQAYAFSASTTSGMRYVNNSLYLYVDDVPVLNASWNGKLQTLGIVAIGGTMTLPDIAIARQAAGVLAVTTGGAALHATPAAATLIGQGGSGTNIAGAPLNVAGGQGTGTGPGGSFIIRTSPAGASGTSLNALVDRVRVDSAGLVEFVTDHADTSSQDPTTDSPADWLTIKHNGTEYVVPLYTLAP